MGFFAPLFLAGMVAVGLPLWLHLLRKHRSPPQPFGSLMFWERHTQSSIKHRRLRYLLLLALRMALFALIALAFARPYIERKSIPFQHTGEITVVAIDNSLSMRAGNLFDQAKQMAKSEISGLRAGERAQAAFGIFLVLLVVHVVIGISPAYGGRPSPRSGSGLCRAACPTGCGGDFIFS